MKINTNHLLIIIGIQFLSIPDIASQNYTVSEKIVNHEVKTNHFDSNNFLILDNLKLSDFTPFSKFLTKQPKAENNIETFEYENWTGELFIKGSLLFNPRNRVNGFTVYDINKMQYGRIAYSTDCNYNDGFQGLIRNNFNNSDAIYSYCNSNIYKNYLEIEDYSNYEYYQYPSYFNNQWHKISPMSILKLPDSGSEFEIEVDGKIYNYKYFRDASGGKKTFYFNSNKDEKLVASAVVKASHNSLDYIYLTTIDNGSISNTKLIDVNKIIDNYPEYIELLKRKELFNKNEEIDWDMIDITYLNDGGILLTIDVKLHIGRSPQGIPFEFAEKSHLGILLNADLTFIKAERLIGADITLMGSSNDIFKIIENGAKVVCYNKDLKVKWVKAIAVENKKNVGSVSYCKEINNKLYLMGTTSNKYHIGKSDPIAWKIDATNGNIISEEVIKLTSSTNSCEGFIFYNNSLYLIILPEKKDYFDNGKNHFLKKISFNVD